MAGFSAAQAQEAEPERTEQPAEGADEALSMNQVVVTGSRIANPNLTSSSSVTVLGAEEFDARGVLRVEDLLSTLPQTLSGESSTSGVSGAQATVNLRGLGSKRTLVVVDGKRLPYGSPINVAADLNQIPSQLVERVEVLTGGATAVYGSDAIAGVVNFIMKRDFEGLEADVQGSLFFADNNNSNIERVLADYNQPDADSITDGESVDFNLIAGRNFDDGRGNITAYFGYSKDKAVRWEDRDITSCPFSTRDGGTDFSCSGSGSMPANTRYLRTGADGFDLVEDEQTGELRPYDQSVDAFNFAYGNYLQRPRERYTYGAFVRYDLREDMEFFLDFSVADNQTDAQIGAAGLATGTTTTINCDNPLLSGDMQAAFCDPSVVTVDENGVPRAPLRIGRRNLDYPRVAEFGLNTQRVVGGIRGEVMGGWDYEVFVQNSVVDYQEVLLNDISVSRVERSIDVVTDPATGNPVCRSVLTGEDPDCVPFNVFMPGGITPEANDYVTTPSLRVGETEQFVFGGSLSGDLGQYGVVSPFAQDGFGAVVGFEYRKDSLSLSPDSADTRTSVRAPVDGEVPVREVFAEVQAPLVQDAAFAEELTLTGAYRYSDYYDTTGGQDTYSLGLAWRPISDLRLRTQYQRATRSPNPIELYSPREFDFGNLATLPNGLQDPCAGDFDGSTSTPEPYLSFEDCALTGVTQDQYGTILDSSGNIDILTGGNEALEPEVSDTWTAGFVYEPSFLPGFVASVDYFSIEVEDYIGSIEPSETINQCVTTGDARYCGLISREPSGTLFLGDGDAYVDTALINTGQLKTSGVDLSASYVFGLDRFGADRFGDVRLSYVSTILDELSTQSLPGEPANECAGMHGGACNNPAPEYRHRVSADWMLDNVRAQLSWRYISSVDEFSVSPSAVNKLEATSYFDASVQYDVSEDLELRAGVNNLLDQDPPLTSLAGYGGDENDGRGNTYPQIYDTQGRFIFAGATVRF
ncbi:TonB-dependent receptor domain-containing protein [Henriciella aquimarina]|uniref:TonB-dependent receptor domain-containing protein n=1 Tax=Henriciella aquimarina TaxID=545261 RepID=UPI000A01ABA6|nr:TonB-dependent receptor [Henriciella aquimarina]